MLKIGLNIKKVRFNLQTVFVYHLTDSIGIRDLPICGSIIDDLQIVGGMDGLFKDIRNNLTPLFSDGESILCARCRAAFLAAATDAEKSVKRGRRYGKRIERQKTEKAQRLYLTEFKNSVAEKYLTSCPECGHAINLEEQSGYMTKEAFCTHCEIRWRFSVLPESPDRFIIFADKSGEIHAYRAQGITTSERITWTSS